MSRQAKPDGVDVLHYRIYEENWVDETLELMPNGGMTLAVRFPQNGDCVLEIGVAHCSAMDSFLRRKGYDEAVGKILSAKQRLVVDRSLVHSCFKNASSFLEKCEALNYILNELWNICPTDEGVSVGEKLFPDRWVKGLHGYCKNGQLLRASASVVENPLSKDGETDHQRVGISFYTI
jgi:hypothetical protein